MHFIVDIGFSKKIAHDKYGKVFNKKTSNSERCFSK